MQTDRFRKAAVAVFLILLSLVPASAVCRRHDDRLVVLINTERERIGVGPLVPGRELDCAAQRHSDDMFENGFFGHVGSDGSSFIDRAEGCGYLRWYFLGETIMGGCLTADCAFGVWMNSSPHRRILLDPVYGEIGVGTAGSLWTAMFGYRPVVPTHRLYLPTI